MTSLLSRSPSAAATAGVAPRRDALPAPAGVYAAVKAAAEPLLAAALLVALGPLIVMLLALTRLTSAGPGLYSQVRLGRGGRAFRIYKVRTMHHDCERQTGARWSTPGDPRVTPLGRVLRDLHLDELPQLWNVLRGEMSLVGPRPERPEIVAQLERVYPDYRGRLAVRPGITGLAQVLLPPDESLAGVRHKLACDLTYVDDRGPWLDARVLAATALKLARVPADSRRRLLALPGRPAEPLSHPRTA
jgi:lipopolysaccharide/colanic/teichoic acid biosynthesis glycosyltransferase